MTVRVSRLEQVSFGVVRVLLQRLHHRVRLEQTTLRVVLEPRRALARVLRLHHAAQLVPLVLRATAIGQHQLRHLLAVVVDQLGGLMRVQAQVS